ncbi:hypothetical protein QJS04_geneDACA008586 [Acorus gramineus]|uniref:Uncharacterized protein n=1 Tax=Acorus gramineus TaxID=55184 RepID=A0AAV9AHF1_ACOGR|nr:hypothetical protein QJS04_geneDACA008586 [Acorus gramineus]
MAAITTLNLVLIVFFLLSLLFISAALFDVLCYRRRFHLRFTATSSIAGDPESAVAWDPYRSPPSKELLLYFLFRKDDPSASAAAADGPPPLPEPMEAEEETPFSTPCASPPFSTPSSSPSQLAASDDVGLEGLST